VDLSFPVDGIIGAQNDIHLLGKPVKAFDLAAFYASLGTILSPTVWVPGTGHGINQTAGRHVTLPASDQPLGWGRLKYDSNAIREGMSGSILFELRAEHVKAALDKAVGLRENVWVQKYERSVFEATQSAFDRDDPNSRLNRLKRLATISQQQHDQLKTEYTDFSGNDIGGYHNGVVKASVTNTSTSAHKLRTTPQGGGSVQDWVMDQPEIINNQRNLSYTRGYEYRHPSLENDAQCERAQISLLDEQLSAASATNFVRGSQVERDATDGFHQSGLPRRYLGNDLRAIDLDIKRLQVAYMDTLLVSPIDGVVTGVFRNNGDSVRAAQAVVRIENDAEIYLVGTLKYRGLLRIGQSISLTTGLFDTESKMISGVVAAVRGHDSEDELWDVLVLCSNRDPAGLPVFPINYNFDFDNTSIEVIV